MLIFYLCRCFASSTIPQVRHSISLPQVGSESTILNHMIPSVLLADVSASLFDLRLYHPLFPSSSSALQVPICFMSSSATNVTRIAHFRCPMPQKHPTPIPAAHVMDVTLNASGVWVCALLETVYSFIGPFCTFLVIPFGLDPFPLSPYSLVAYMYIPSVPGLGRGIELLNCRPLILPIPFLCLLHCYLCPLCLLKQARQRP